jgi:hypothetical protein
MRGIEKANPHTLYGILGDAQWTNKDHLSDVLLRDRIEHFAGSDKRGTIYGVYQLSEQIGVSPWYWWADVPPKHHDALFVKPGRQVQGPPTVKYRRIFINDEEPALGPWAREKFGGVNARMYAHVFELLLRLRANFLWPAMWGKSIYEDDPESALLADECGIALGTLHPEPMTRAQQDWTRNKQHYGTGEWDYSTHAEGLRKFWAEGITRNKDYEVLITLGMRGDGDEPMAAWQELAAEAGRINDQLPPEDRDAIYELVLYPAKASATVAEMHIATGRNHLYAAQGRAGANDQAQRVRELFQLDKELSAAYHQLVRGKWKHMMSQTHIGYNSSRDPETNIMPQVVEVARDGAPAMRVAIEGSTNAWPGGSRPAYATP